MLELNDSNFDQEVTSASGVVVVDFWATWCGPCRALAPRVEEVANEYAGKAKVAKFNIETSEDVPAKFGIRTIPVLLFFKDGELKDKSTGLVNKADIAAKIDALL